MYAEFTLQSLAARIGLETETIDYSDAGGELRLLRHRMRVVVPAEVRGRLDPTTPPGRRLAWGVFFGIRLALDHVFCEFDPAQERVAHQSLYGERLPRLVTRPTLAWFEALTGADALRSDWLLDDLEAVYILETGKCLHTLSMAELERLPMPPEKLLADAQHALFYESYKLKPSEKERSPEGLIRVFCTAEGLGASRALLLPDYDYEAAREGGCFANPSRDAMIIGRPVEPGAAAAAIRERVEALTAEMHRSAEFPLCSTIFEMTPDRAFATSKTATSETATKDAVDAVMPPPGAQIYSRE
jgi:hypothetical protein